VARKKREIESSGTSWLDTYADMVTLLLTFFIMLYAMSTIDAQKYNAIVEAFSKGKAVITDIELPKEEDMPEDGYIEEVIAKVDLEEDSVDKLYTMLMNYVTENKLTESVEITKSEEYVFIRFYDNITFNGYSNQLKTSGKDILSVLAEGLGLVEEYIEEVIIAGHTAEVKNDNTTIDRNLSTERANAVLQYLEAKRVINPAKYLAIGYGLYTPIADNDTAEGRSKNRRVEIYISRKGHPVSYTNIIDKAINEKESTENDTNIENDSNSNSNINNIESYNSFKYRNSTVIE